MVLCRGAFLVRTLVAYYQYNSADHGWQGRQNSRKSSRPPSSLRGPRVPSPEGRNDQEHTLISPTVFQPFSNPIRRFRNAFLRYDLLRTGSFPINDAHHSDVLVCTRTCQCMGGK